jgi:hypothetical protein
VSLVALLEAGTTQRALRPAVAAVIDERGRWLASLHPDWSWALAPGAPEAADADDAAWARLPTDRRAVQLRAVRGVDAARGLRLLESTWSTDDAAARAELLRALGVGLSLDDEAFLERALDDRAAGVREVAWLLLDRLPESARAARLGRLLQELLGVSGVVRKKVHVELPSDPDPSAVRDGLGKAPRGRSQRGLWLQRLAAGAPLDVWTRGTGLDPETVARTLDDDDALLGLRAAAVGRGDATWCRALLARAWDPTLARCLPDEELRRLMIDRLAQVKSLSELVGVARLAPGPWSPDVSAKVVARLGRVERPRSQLVELVDVLADRLHPDSAAAVQRLTATEDTGVPLHQLSQFLTLVPTITEAFR